MPYFVYILQCSDGSYYTGMTTDLSKRLTEHETGADPKAYTFNRRPVKLVWQDSFLSQDEAFRAEHQIKGWSRKKKESLLQNDWAKIHEIVTEERKAREVKKRVKSDS